MNMALQCGLQTYTQVRSKNGSTGTSNAAGQMDVRVRVKNLGSDLASLEDDGPWINTIPSNLGGLGADPVDDVGVTYCYRFQELAATLTGINCTANLTTGAVTCDDPESISLLLDTFEAHSFNFLVADLQSGVHQISVEARARADAAVFSTSADPETIGAAKGRAFAGAGALIVEKGRLVKGQDTGLIQTID
jgi:hypothetical protein